MPKKNITDLEEFLFSDPSFNILMQKRIRRVLLICSNYDAYMLEEDGRIDEQIFDEYVSQNLSNPPVFIQANSAKKAFEILENESIDLVIEMLNIGDTDPFELAKKIKGQFKNIPVVVLTHFSREVSIKLQYEDLSAIDYVFCWLGNADLLLAIIKLLEDKMNVDHDVKEVGVQTVLFVEDSIRFISTFLPNIYKVLFEQSRDFGKEALNEHQKMLRMRGRPKLLLAKSYDEAIQLYNKYKNNLLGVISDISFSNKGQKVKDAGLVLLKKIRKDDQFMPFLLQSSNRDIEKMADSLKVGFIYKYSKTLSLELREYIKKQFAFGDFIFRDPTTLREISRASNLQQFQEYLLTIPDGSLKYHASRNDFSKWLNARALFPIARILKSVSNEDFENVVGIREFVYEAISNFRISKGRGIIARFNKESFNKYLMFTRMGEGSIGGKARGLAFIDSFLKKNKLYSKFNGVRISIPKTVAISTDYFDKFMEDNCLYDVGLSNLSDGEILNRFVESLIPNKVKNNIKVFVSVIKNPIAIRSSSKLEDSHYQPFAGLYSTYFIPYLEDDPERTFEMVLVAIKCVYASVFFKSSKAYISATSNIIDEEKMGIILQEVCGSENNGMFYPTLSGVARSINYYPVPPESSNDGIVNIAYGLGKMIVEGAGNSLRFSPKYPKKILQLASTEMAIKDTQQNYYALDLNPEKFIPSTNDAINFLKLPISEAENDRTFKYAASTYDFENNIIKDSIYGKGKRIITFNHLLNYDIMPLAEVIDTILKVSVKEMNCPVEIEFAVNLDVPDNLPFTFNILQIRPIVYNEQTLNFKIDNVDKNNCILFSESVLGNGNFKGISDIIIVDPTKFIYKNSELIARDIENINKKFIEEDRNYILIGPGRWGSNDPSLGIPVNWAQISQARIIVEASTEQHQIEPSQGTHFFQNITSFGVGYCTINPIMDKGYFDLKFMESQTFFYQSKFLTHYRFDEELSVQLDGKNNLGVIYKPGFVDN